MITIKNFKNIIIGIALVAAGLIFGLNALGYTNINIFFDGWWTLFIIIPCLVDLIRGHNLFGNLTGMSVGVLLLLICQGLVDVTTISKLIFPAVLVCIGVRLIFRNVFSGKTAKKIKDINDSSARKGCYAAGSNQKFSIAGESFDGCDLTAAFGSIDCDLLFSQVPADAVINARVTFGAIRILMPQSVNVVVKSTSFFGGVSQKRSFPAIANAPTVYVNATCLFGGVELK